MLGKIQKRPWEIVLAAGVAVTMLILTFFAWGGNKKIDYLPGIGGAERWTAVAAQAV